MLERFGGMQNSKPVTTPLTTNFCLSAKLSPETDEKEHMSCVPYSSFIDSLMYAMVCTRPDISHVVSVVSRYMENSSKEHWHAVKWILCYLKGTSDVGLVYERNSDTHSKCR